MSMSDYECISPSARRRFSALTRNPVLLLLLLAAPSAQAQTAQAVPADGIYIPKDSSNIQAHPGAFGQAASLARLLPPASNYPPFMAAVVVRPQQPEPARVRSLTRTAIGIGWIGGGLVMALYNQKCALDGPKTNTVFAVFWEYRAVKSGGDCFIGGTYGLKRDDGAFVNGGEEVPLRARYPNFGGPDTVAKRGRGTLSKGLRYTGVGLAVTGALITVFWSDVPSAFQDIGINVLPDGFVASRSFDW